MNELTAGQMNRRVSIQTESSVQDSLGQALQIWTTGYTCWASIDVQNSQLQYSTAEFIERVTYRITLRWTSSFQFLPNQRVLYTEQTTGITTTFNIESIVNDKQANKQLTLLCYALNGTA